MNEEYKLSHLKELEAESIHIIREVTTGCDSDILLIIIIFPSLPLLRSTLLLT